MFAASFKFNPSDFICFNIRFRILEVAIIIDFKCVRADILVPDIVYC